MTTSPPLFIELSEALTGVENLPADLAAEYWERLHSSLATDLEDLVTAFGLLKAQGQLNEQSLASELFSNPKLSNAAQQLIVLWYSSALMEPDAKGVVLKFGKPAHHFRALLWDAIGAHPPALSGGYFGHWHYPPEN